MTLSIRMHSEFILDITDLMLTDVILCYVITDFVELNVRCIVICAPWFHPHKYQFCYNIGLNFINIGPGV